LKKPKQKDAFNEVSLEKFFFRKDLEEWKRALPLHSASEMKDKGKQKRSLSLGVSD
jgi:hypothetical protein